MTAALMSGGRHYMGWGETRHLLAHIYDALNLNTRATGNWGKQPPNFEPWPRPNTRSAAPAKKKTSVADLYNRFPKGG